MFSRRSNNKRHREEEEKVEVASSAVVSSAASLFRKCDDSVVKELPTPVVLSSASSSSSAAAANKVVSVSDLTTTTTTTSNNNNNHNDNNDNNNHNKRLKKKSSSSSSVLDDLLCPITYELPIEPVTAEDGRIYERTAIEEYFRRCRYHRNRNRNRNNHNNNNNNNRRRRRRIISRNDRTHHHRRRRSSSSSSSSSSTTTITTNNNNISIVKSPMTNQCMGTRLLPAIQTCNIIESLINHNLIDDNDDLILSWKQRKRRIQQQFQQQQDDESNNNINNKNCSLLYASHYKSIRSFREYETRIMTWNNIIEDSNSILEHHRPGITYTMRSILIDWLIEIDYSIFRCQPQNIHLTVNLVDRYLSLQESTLSQTKLQLVGVTCFWIATKYTTSTTTTTASSTASSTTPKEEETTTTSSTSSSDDDDDVTNRMIEPPGIDDLVYICSNAYTRSQILKMEKKINKVLQLQQLHHPLSSSSSVPSNNNNNNNNTMLLLLPNDNDFLDGLLYALDHHDTKNNNNTATATATNDNKKNRIRHLTRLILDGILFNCHLLYDRQYRRSDIITAAFYIAYCSCNNNNNNNGGDDTSIREGSNNNNKNKNSWWNSTLQQYTNYSSINKGLLSIAHEVLLSHQNEMKRNTRIHTSLNAIEKKYSKVQYGQVANIQLIINDDDNDEHEHENDDHRHPSSSLASSLSSSCIIS